MQLIMLCLARKEQLQKQMVLYYYSMPRMPGQSQTNSWNNIKITVWEWSHILDIATPLSRVGQKNVNVINKI